MSEDFSWGLQKAVYAVLTDNDPLKALIGDPPSIYDAPPRKSAFPYITLGESRVKDWPGVDGGLEHDLRIHVYSRYRGRREVQQILNAIYDALHEADFIIEGRRLVHIRFVFADIFPRREGGAFQGAARFRVMTQTEAM